MEGSHSHGPFPPDQVLVVLVTVPDAATGESISRGVLEARLAACVNRVSGVVSLFRWEGKIAQEEEQLLILKTRADRFEELRRRLVELHPYTTPEVLALPVVAGHPDYVRWVGEETAP